jgi:hypothetical protein
MGTPWNISLLEAQTADEVAMVCAGFIGALTPQELADLPARLHPPDILDADSIALYAMTLIRMTGIDDLTLKRPAYTMSRFFTKAALRLADLQVAARPPSALSTGSSAKS